MKEGLRGHSLDALVEAEIYRFTGTFLFVLDCRGVRRIYVDAAGTICRPQ